MFPVRECPHGQSVNDIIPAVVNPILNTTMPSVTQRFVEAAQAEHDSGTRPCLARILPAETTRMKRCQGISNKTRAASKGTGIKEKKFDRPAENSKPSGVHNTLNGKARLTLSTETGRNL